MGGAVAIRTEQFKKINGMSNMFFGWGGEDDDFSTRSVTFILNFYYIFISEILENIDEIKCVFSFFVFSL